MRTRLWNFKVHSRRNKYYFLHQAINGELESDIPIDEQVARGWVYKMAAEKGYVEAEGGQVIRFEDISDIEVFPRVLEQGAVLT